MVPEIMLLLMEIKEVGGDLGRGSPPSTTARLVAPYAKGKGWEMKVKKRKKLLKFYIF